MERRERGRKERMVRKEKKGVEGEGYRNENKSSQFGCHSWPLWINPLLIPQITRCHTSSFFGYSFSPIIVRSQVFTV